jgi:multiple sugar transport system ATP-binding protein
MARVAIENLSKVFKGAKGEQIYAVKDLTLAIEDKELLVLVGPSGCGKTTTLRMIAGLEEISHGTISIAGEVVNNIPARDRDIAMVFQNYALYPHMTVYENMAFGLKLRKVPKAEIDKRVKEAAEILGLLPCLDRHPKALSGGERQRVAVGRAMVRKPKLFLLDEPLSNLDAPLRAQMRAEISKLHRRLEATMIYVTHDQAEAMTMGDRIAVMKEGVMQQVAAPRHAYDCPANLFVARFIGSPPMNCFQGTVLQKTDALYFVEPMTEGRPVSFTARVPAEAAKKLLPYSGKKVVLGLRAEDFFQVEGKTKRENVLSGTVEVAEPMGAETCLHLTTGVNSFVARLPSDCTARVSEEVMLAFDVRKARFFDPATGLALS